MGLFQPVGIPVYEGLKAVAIDFIQELGFGVAVDAYFNGQWNSFNSKVLSVAKYTAQEFWKNYSVLSHTAQVYLCQPERISALIGLGIQVPVPTELKDLVESNLWTDPLISMFPLTHLQKTLTLDPSQ